MRARTFAASRPGAAAVALAVLVACGAPGGAGSHPGAPGRREGRSARGAERGRSPRTAPARPASARDLGADATFADLVEAVRHEDDRRDQDSDAGCLLREDARGIRLEADLAVAVRPLPAAADDLDARLARDRGPVRLLTRFGSVGSGSATTALVAMTTALPPAQAPALALFLTDRGLHARRSDRADAERDAASIDRLLGELDGSAWDLVALTAEAGVPLRALVELLRRLPAGLAGRVVLAVPLAEGTRLPDPPLEQARSEPEALCAEGLAELGEDDPVGDLAPARIRAGLEPLVRAAELCVGASTGPGAAGGRIALAVRVAPDGRTHDACVTEDAIGDPALRACLVRAARALVFDSPGGYLDFALPLALEPGRAHRQAPLCPAAAR